MSPEEWYQALDIRQEIVLPDFVYDKHQGGPSASNPDLALYLIYATEMENHSAPHRGFTVVAPRIHASHAEGDLLKIFVTTYSAAYRLYDNVLDMTAASVVPAAITYKMIPNGMPELVEYQQARDGSDFAKSIREFCTLPESGAEISGLADRILNHYGNYSDIVALQYSNLRQHLIENGITNATYTNARGEVVLSIP